jgi:hypothetical protein
MIDDDECGAVGRIENWERKMKESKKKNTCLNATPFTTNATLPDMGSNPGRPQCEAGDFPPELWNGP